VSCREGDVLQAAWRDTLWLLVATLLVRLAVIVWGASRFPPAADGQFYQVVASRIGQGLGYTWLWPDGIVTYAAHYPVGYPAILGGLYSVFGAKPWLAMVLNGLAGVVTTLCVHRLAIATGSRRSAFFAGIVAALHPTLVFYTPAMMTELVSAALLIGAVALSMMKPHRALSRVAILLALGLLIGVSTLVRPQQLLWAPLLGGLLAFRVNRGRPTKSPKTALIARMVLSAGFVSVVAIGCCLPWTIRNCDKMERCVFVSANGGWNLFIGASPLGRGAWTSIDSIGVPAECRLVFKEAEKDFCFGNVAKRVIAQRPLAWFALIPAKLSKTFDDVGAPGYYLHSSNGWAFDDKAKWRLGAAEVLVERVLSLLAFCSFAFASGPRQRTRFAIAGLAALTAFVPYVWIGVLLYGLGALLLGARLVEEPAILLLTLAWVMTAGVHAVFFGGARYVIVVLPLLMVAAARGVSLLPTPSWTRGHRS